MCWINKIKFGVRLSIKIGLSIKFHSMPVCDKTYIKAKENLTVKLRQTF